MTSLDERAERFAREETERISQGQDWHGHLTVRNADAVAARLQAMLEGRLFAVMTEPARPYRPDAGLQAQSAGGCFLDVSRRLESPVSVSRAGAGVSVSVETQDSILVLMSAAPDALVIAQGYHDPSGDALLSLAPGKALIRQPVADGAVTWLIVTEAGALPPEEA